jgi:phosphoribosyl 1,2-cyclic phosphodiesterase
VRVKIWGCRGSLPVAMSTTRVRDKLRTALTAANGRNFADDAERDKFITEELPWAATHTFGGNTSCVQIDTGGPEYIICDLGSGLREFGASMMLAHGPAKPQIYNIFMSHLHWDHIMGFPFFPPAYIPGNIIRIYSCHPDPRAAFLRQQSAPCFPVNFETLSATIEFVPMRPGETYTAAGAAVRALLQNHEGDSYGYRFEKDGKSVVYTTDSEHKPEDEANRQRFVEFFREAGLVIFDAQYSLAETVSLKEDWGHSSNIAAVELCRLSQTEHLLLYHHEPAFDDNMLYRIWQETIRYEELMRDGGTHVVHVSSAYDGLEIDL